MNYIKGLNVDGINNCISKFDDFLVFCDPDFKNQIYSKIENSLKINGQLQGEALTPMMNNLKAQYENHLDKLQNQIDLKNLCKSLQKIK